jgi:hypothetical protein
MAGQHWLRFCQRGIFPAEELSRRDVRPSIEQAQYAVAFIEAVK